MYESSYFMWLYIYNSVSNTTGGHIYEDIDLKKEEKRQLKKTRSVGKKKTSSNHYRNPLQLPERKYLEDPDFVKELESNTEEAPTIPERNYMDDTQFVYDLNAELFPDIPELPSRCYLEDAEFLADLEDDGSQVAALSLQDSSEGAAKQLFGHCEKDITNQRVLSTEHNDHKNVLSDPSESDEEPMLSMHAHKESMPAGQYMSLCEATKATQAERGNNHPQEGAYMSLHNTSSEKQEGVNKKSHHHSESGEEPVHAYKESMPAGQYMSLCKATKTAQAERGNNFSQEGAYMSLHNTRVDEKSHHHSESEYTSLRLGKLSVVDERKNDSNEQYMSLNESTRERKKITGGAALRILQAEN